MSSCSPPYLFDQFGRILHVTSSTRPTGVSRYTGQIIYETDTLRYFRYSGAAWQFMGGNPPRVAAAMTAAISLSNSTLASVTWNTEAYDTDGFHSTTTNTQRLTVPAGLGGLYLASFALTFGAGAGGGDRQAFMIVNGVSGRYSSTQVNAHAAGYTFQTSGHAAIPLLAGEYVEVQAFQNSGAALNLNPTLSDYFTLTWIGLP